jgi:hypothetical protein
MDHRKPKVAVIGNWFRKLFQLHDWHDGEIWYETNEQYWYVMVRNTDEND